MNVREGTPADGDAIRSIAQRSLEASYSLSPAAIQGAVEQWYDEEGLGEKFDDEDYRLLVVEDDGEVVAFSESVLVDDRGDVLWLHVDPDHRGRGIGDDLYEETRSRLEAADAHAVRGLVLADNQEGNAFYERHGLRKAGQDEVEIDGEPYVENIYVGGEAGGLEAVTYEDRQLYVDRSDAERGSEGQFLAVFTDADRENRYGYYCGNCESVVTTMDSMGRVECPTCGNVRKPVRWDAAYL